MAETQAMQAEAPDGNYAFFDGLHKSCSKCKQVCSDLFVVHSLSPCYAALHRFPSCSLKIIAEHVVIQAPSA